jgi:hypothetical protein
MFDIEGKHIAKLNDTDLRTLIARLCEAEVRRAGLPASAVTAGGDQDAKDGGVDVRVDLPPGTEIRGFIPRPSTGFQVKVPDMQPKAIVKEMRPRGTIRPVIKELASVSGAYIIVSANGSTTDSSLKRRRQAMTSATAGIDARELTLGFYDRDQIARWVRQHPGMVAWVRDRIDEPIRGWLPYTNWTRGEAVDAEYLVDDRARLYDWRSPEEGPVDINEGIRRLRQLLARPKNAARLIGLSGTGKTRLAQALFDDRVSDQPLEPALAIYTDISQQPDPPPRGLMRRLIEDRRRAVVIVDNCPPETHGELAAICTEQESELSLLTIEFDIEEDDPEGTEVFRLDVASEEVIERLLERRVPKTGKLDRRRIAELSGGNARIALALARTVQRKGSVANLADKDLFERLFYQRQSRDDNLMLAAEACSLVYSFDGETLEGDGAELPVLAGLAGLSLENLFRFVGQLKARELVQSRGKWRAVLPQALGNRLAEQALERIPSSKVLSAFSKPGQERMLRSFSRRLGYLHDCEAAKGIVRTLFSEGGDLSNPASLSPLQIAIFENISPVDPAAALQALESAANGDRGDAFLDVSASGRSNWIYLLKSIAYDQALFDRSARLLARFVLAEPPDQTYKSARGPFSNLFQTYLSGTHASLEQRLQVVRGLLASDDERHRSLGLEALETMLDTHFSSSYTTSFGARSRDYGLHPAPEDMVAWYRASIEYVKDVAVSGGEAADGAKSVLARKFHGLWVDPQMTDELESAVRAVAARGFWPEGWVAVCETVRSDGRYMPPEVLARLKGLEADCRPVDLLETARAYVFSDTTSAPGLVDRDTGPEDEDAAAAYDRAGKTTEALGCQIADTSVLKGLLPDLVRGNFHRGWNFGRGVAEGAGNLANTWNILVDALSKVPESERNALALQGFLSAAGVRDPGQTAALLDAAVSDPILGPLFPILQASVGIDESAARRLEEALKLRLAPARAYHYLTRSCDVVPPGRLRSILLGIASLLDGYEVAVTVLAMHLYSAREAVASTDPELIECGRELLRQCPFTRPGQRADHFLGFLADFCLRGEDGVKEAVFVCRKLKSALSDYRSYAFYYSGLACGLFRVQPSVALDELVGGQQGGGPRSRIIDLGRKNPLMQAPAESVIAWAQVDPKVRFPLLASMIIPFQENDNRTQLNKAELKWAPMALRVLDMAPDKEAVLDAFGASIRMSLWAGPGRVNTPESCRSLAKELLSDPDPQIVAWAKRQDAELASLAEKQRLQERRMDESFE